jgi:polar amino acid transport system substrate-binding protein
LARLVVTEIGMYQTGDLMRADEVRVALFPPQFDKCAASGEPRGWPVDLARAVGARLGVDVRVLGRPSPREVLDDLRTERADLAFLSIHRSDDADFTPPFLQVDFTCLVPAASAIRRVADVDRPGIRIAVVREHASTLALSRIAKQAELVPADVPDAAFHLLRSGQADALASVRPWLLEVSARLPDTRVLE